MKINKNINITLLFVLFLSLISVFVGILFHSEVVENSNIKKLSTRIFDGHTFAVELLKRQRQKAADLRDRRGLCFMDAERSDAVVALNLLELIPSEQFLSTKVQEQLERALTCHPADGYLWLAQAWLSFAEGHDHKGREALSLSFSYAPREGWIVRKRLFVALSVFDRLDSLSQQKTVQDFSALVHHFYYAEALEALTGVGRPYAGRLTASLSSIPSDRLQVFTKALDRKDPDLGQILKKDRR
jgi:hypothetical protein